MTATIGPGLLAAAALWPVRAATIIELVQRAHWAEEGESEDSLYLALAVRLRELAAQVTMTR